MFCSGGFSIPSIVEGRKPASSLPLSRLGPKDVAEERKKRKLAEDGLKAIKAKDAGTIYRTLEARWDTREFARVEERLEGFPFGLEPAFIAIL